MEEDNDDMWPIVIFAPTSTEPSTEKFVDSFLVFEFNAKIKLMGFFCVQKAIERVLQICQPKANTIKQI